MVTKVVQKDECIGTSLAVQWLGLCASIAGGAGLIPVRGTKILHAARHGQNKQENNWPERFETVSV